MLCDGGQSGLGGGDDSVPVLVCLLVRDDRPHVARFGELFHRGDGLGDVELVVVVDGQLAGFEDAGGGAGGMDHVGDAVGALPAGDLFGGLEGRVAGCGQGLDRDVPGPGAAAEELVQGG